MRYVSLADLKGVGKKTFEALRKAEVKTLEDLKLVDRSQLSERTGLSETLLQDILLRAELQAFDVPPDAANALVASGAIGRAGELAAFEAEEVQSLLSNGVTPSETIDASIEAIEAWKARLPRLSLDEEMYRGTVQEETATALHEELEPALIAEEPVVSKHEVEHLIAGLEKNLQQLSGKMQAVATAPDETIDLVQVRAMLSSLQADIHTTFVQSISRMESGLGVAVGEDDAPAFADEEMEPEVQIQALSRQLTSVQGQLAELQARRVAANEDLSPAAAEEGEPVALRGE